MPTFPANDEAHPEALELGRLIRDWQPRRTAPKDGTPIEIALGGRDHEHGFHFHAFPHPVQWLDGRWVFVSTKAPVLPCFELVRWRPIDPNSPNAGGADG